MKIETQRLDQQEIHLLEMDELFEKLRDYYKRWKADLTFKKVNITCSRKTNPKISDLSRPSAHK